MPSIYHFDRFESIVINAAAWSGEVLGNNCDDRADAATLKAAVEEFSIPKQGQTSSMVLDSVQRRAFVRALSVYRSRLGEAEETVCHLSSLVVTADVLGPICSARHTCTKLIDTLMSY